MLTIWDRPSRRKVLQAAGAGLLGLNLPELLRAEQSGSATPRRARSVIFLFLFGGPSQLETFDMKPEAPDTIRGPFRPTPCRTPGLHMCEHLPRLANLSDKFSIIRTMTHTFNDHSGGGHYLQTGHRWHIPVGGGFSATPRDWPSMGSVMKYLDQQSGQGNNRDLPYYMVVPNRLGRLQSAGQYVRPGEYAGWLGRAFNPVPTKVDKRNSRDNPYWRNCTDEELTFQIDNLTPPNGIHPDRVNTRVSLLQQFESQQRLFENNRTTGVFDHYQQRALDLVTSERTRRALDIRREPPLLRDMYGRHLFGQSCLMARRLVEAGVRFVTVHYDAVDGYSWDSHRNSEDVRHKLLPTFDQSLAALLQDLESRGMLEDTLVIALGEMGRTPQGNANWGRNHWSTLFPALLAGGGIKRGYLHGRSDRQASRPLEHPTSPEDLAATVYHALGVDPELRVPDAEGRPVPVVHDGNVIESVFA